MEALNGLYSYSYEDKYFLNTLIRAVADSCKLQLTVRQPLASVLHAHAVCNSQ